MKATLLCRNTASAFTKKTAWWRKQNNIWKKSVERMIIRRILIIIILYYAPLRFFITHSILWILCVNSEESNNTMMFHRISNIFSCKFLSQLHPNSAQFILSGPVCGIGFCCRLSIHSYPPDFIMWTCLRYNTVTRIQKRPVQAPDILNGQLLSMFGLCISLCSWHPPAISIIITVSLHKGFKHLYSSCSGNMDMLRF